MRTVALLAALMIAEGIKGQAIIPEDGVDGFMFCFLIFLAMDLYQLIWRNT